MLHNITAGGPHRDQITGIEITGLDEHRVLLGVQMPGITELFGESLDGEIFDVFTINDGVITGVREFHVRHPDGHIFRISTNL